MAIAKKASRKTGSPGNEAAALVAKELEKRGKSCVACNHQDGQKLLEALLVEMSRHPKAKKFDKEWLYNTLCERFPDYSACSFYQFQEKHVPKHCKELWDRAKGRC